MHAQSLSHVWLFVTPTDCSPQGSAVHGISQARIVDRVIISFSIGSSQPRDQTHMSCIGRWILYHWTTREARYLLTSDKKYKYHGKCITRSRIRELCVCEILCYGVVLCILCVVGVWEDCNGERFQKELMIEVVNTTVLYILKLLRD